MRKRFDWLDSAGGHIAVALFIFLVGVGMEFAERELGKEIAVAALASLWTAIRTPRTGKDDSHD